MNAPPGTVSRRVKLLVSEGVGRAVRRLVRPMSADARREIAVRWSVSESTVIRWSGGALPTFNQAVRIAPLVGVDPTTGRSAV